MVAPGGHSLDLVVVADAHIDCVEPDAREFETFLEGLGGTTAELILLGDIFALWLGEPKYTLPHHEVILAACRRLRGRGVRVVFVEGNREFGGRRWQGDAFDEVGDERILEAWGGRRWRLSHGELLNREDWPGRIFRRAVRSRAARGLLRALPAGAGLKLARRVARLLGRLNLRHKTAIPDARFARYGSWLAERGFDAGVIGHVHVELALDAAGPASGGGKLFILPDWDSTRRFLRIPEQGAPRFEGWGGAGPPAPAVIAVHERRGVAALRLERAPGLASGDACAISSGHRSQARAGRVILVDPDDPARLTVGLVPGPRIQIGDRLTSVPPARSAEHGIAAS